ncbi:hypothetical protein FRC01_005111, partial [Tulasnella sp. 417]
MQLVLERRKNNDDYGHLFTLLCKLNTYMTINNLDGMGLEILQYRVMAVANEANRMKALIDSDQLVQLAVLAFRAELKALVENVILRD